MTLLTEVGTPTFLLQMQLGLVAVQILFVAVVVGVEVESRVSLMHLYACFQMPGRHSSSPLDPRPCSVLLSGALLMRSEFAISARQNVVAPREVPMSTGYAEEEADTGS